MGLSFGTIRGSPIRHSPGLTREPNCDGAITGSDQGTVQSVHLLGHSGKLTWKQTDQGLVVALPAKAPCEHAFVLKITGKGL